MSLNDQVREDSDLPCVLCTVYCTVWGSERTCQNWLWSPHFTTSTPLHLSQSHHCHIANVTRGQTLTLVTLKVEIVFVSPLWNLNRWDYVYTIFIRNNITYRNQLWLFITKWQSLWELLRFRCVYFRWESHLWEDKTELIVYLSPGLSLSPDVINVIVIPRWSF